MDPKPAAAAGLRARLAHLYELADTEDREAALEYFEELMTLFGVDKFRRAAESTGLWL